MPIIKTKALLIAGTASGVGKTTVATGLMAALSKRYKVQPFKVGLDFIDPGHHTQILRPPLKESDSLHYGRERSNWNIYSCIGRRWFLYNWGVMGCLTGLIPRISQVLPTSQKSWMCRSCLLWMRMEYRESIAAVVKGFSDFDKGVDIQGIILNNVGSERHLKLIKDSLMAQASKSLFWGRFQ